VVQAINALVSAHKHSALKYHVSVERSMRVLSDFTQFAANHDEPALVQAQRSRGIVTHETALARPPV
jgi:hypothetical protein